MLDAPCIIKTDMELCPYNQGGRMADRKKKVTKDRMLMLRMAETEHMRLKLWARDKESDMAKVVRTRLKDIIAPQDIQVQGMAP